MSAFSIRKCLLVSLLVTTFGAEAGDVGNVEQSQLELSSLDKAHAASWHLSDDEYRRYKAILQTSRNYFTPNLDKNPLLALALEATSEAERKAYADRWVQIQYENNFKVIAWTLEVDAAWKRNYPGIPPFTYGQPRAQKYAVSSMMKNQVIVSPTNSGERVKIFLSTKECTQCDIAFNKLLRQLKAKEISGIDVFFAGTVDKKEIIRWTMKQGVSVEDVNKYRKVTLNPAGDEYLGELPYIE